MSNSINSTQDAAKGGSSKKLFAGAVRGIASVMLNKAQFHDVNHIKNVAKLGDLLEFQRGYYSHYALYLGDGRVMNVEAEDVKTTEALIRERKLEDVCRDSKVRISNHEDVARTHFQASPKSMYDIMRAAKSFENKVVPYQFHFRNCEYYCTLWRYGKGFSTQAAKPTTTPVGMVVQEMSQAFNASGSLLEAERYDKYKALTSDI